jgi:hypothetical protein
MSGPLADPDLDATVQPGEVRAVLTTLPAPLTLAGGAAQVARGILRLARVGARLLDARVTLSGSVEDYASPDRRLDLTLAAGTAGAEALDWARARWKVDPRALPRPPVVLDAGRLKWAAAEASEGSVEGALRLAGDARVEIDLAWGPETVHLRRFALKDADSDVTGALRWAPSRASLAYAGRIDDRTIARVMARPPAAPTRLSGNFRADVDLVEPRRSTATGSLAGEGLDLLEHWGWPVSIERVRLEAAGRGVTIANTSVKLAGQRVTLGGSVAIRPSTFAVDLRAEAGQLDAGRLRDAFSRSEAHRPSKPGAWNLPVEGRVRVAVKSLALAEHVVESITGAVSLEPGRAVVDLTQATLCGVSVPVNATLTPGVATVAGRLVASGASLDTLLPCVLPGRELIVTGRLDGDAEYAASGSPGELARRLTASFRARGRDGRIRHGTVGPRILALRPVAERIEADLTQEVTTRGLRYREMAVAGTLDAGRVRIERFTLDAPILGIGMTGQVDVVDEQLALRGVIAPFGTATAALRRIPLLGRLFGARVLGVPFSVSGDWNDPRVSPLGPEAIAGSLLDLLGSALNAPIQLLNPLLPSRERAP